MWRTLRILVSVVFFALITFYFLDFAGENKDADFTAENITYNDLGCGTFDAVVQGERKHRYKIRKNP